MPGAERQHDHVLRAATRADRPLGDRGGIRIVVDRDGQAQVVLRALAQRHALDRDVDREHGGAFALVDRRRDADADRGDAVVPEAVDDRREPRQEGLGGLDRRVPPLRAEHGPVTLDDAREDLRAADVDADGALGRHSRRLP